VQKETTLGSFVFSSFGPLAREPLISGSLEKKFQKLLGLQWMS